VQTSTQLPLTHQKGRRGVSVAAYVWHKVT
jgi:hypothetical protein